MSIFRCPLCNNRIGGLQKYWQSAWGKGYIECSSCGGKLQLKVYGSSRSDATLVVIFTYFFLGIEKWVFPLSFFGVLCVSFLRKILSPLIQYDPEQKVSAMEWVVIIVAAIGLLVGLWLEFIAA